MTDTNFLTSHIVKLPEKTREHILGSEVSCQALFSSLSALAKQYVLRTVFSGEISPAVCQSWATEDKSALSYHERATTELLNLGIWQLVGQNYKMHSSFTQQMLAIVEQGFETMWSEPDAQLQSSLPAVDKIQNHAQSCWESILLFLAGKEELAISVAEQTASVVVDFSEPLDLEIILTRLGLLSIDDVGEAQTTAKGFQFLLKSPADQIWTILDEFLRMQYDLRQEEGAAAVSFLLQLGYCEEGRVCALSDFNKWEVKATCGLTQLGLLYPFTDQNGNYWILPTHLSKLLICRHDEFINSTSSAAGEGIVVETNYRVYAYTSSQVQRTILQLFTTQEYVLPNLYVGRLTRESCTMAFESGISANLIVDYLRRNAHFKAIQTRVKTPVVPANIADGVRLWESESKRMELIPAALYESFDSPKLYEATEKHAKELGALLWCDEKNHRIAVHLTFYDQMRMFIKETKAKQQNS